MKSADERFNALLRDYIDAFLDRVASNSASQTPIPVALEFAKTCQELGIWFKTSFGHGSPRG